jgi:hypothetical protein
MDPSCPYLVNVHALLPSAAAAFDQRIRHP